MGNHRFRLSDMMPNAWFYKLKDIGTKPRKRTTWSTSQPSKKKYPTTDEQPPQHFTQHRNSYYFTSTESFISSHKLHNSPINPKVSDVHFPDPPGKSSKRRSRRRSTMNSNSKLVSSVSAGCSCRVSLDSVWAKPTDSAPDSSYFPSPDPSLHECTLPEFETQPHSSSWPSSPSCSPSLKFRGLDSVPVLELPPILTKPAKVDDVTPAIKNREVGTIKTRRSLPVKEDTVKKTHKQNRTSPRCSAISPGVKIRPNSPKIASKKIQAYCRKSSIANTKLATSHRKRVSESYAIIKSSTDPWRDFKESMVEMIVENNIRASKDLEDLLACYLSLNSNEYHDVIVKVFEQIWFDLVDIQLVKFSFSK